MGLRVTADLSQLTELSFFVDEIANCARDPRAPFVGSTAFAHKGGVHVHAVQKFARSYEHMDPAAVGNRQSILISELSGQSNVLAKVKGLGLKLEKGSPEVAAILAEVKRLENQGYEFEAAEASFELLVRKQLGRHQPLFTLHEYHCDYRRTGNRDYETCEATVKLSVRDRLEYTVAEGDGPVNALDAALRKALRPFYPQIDSITLQDYKVRIIDGHQGTAARTRVLIVSSDGRDVWSTVGASGNIIEASWLALIDGFEYKLANCALALDAA
jgi:2-isopropylmalate synthase